jgi:hypothetical protein
MPETQVDLTKRHNGRRKTSHKKPYTKKQTPATTRGQTPTEAPKPAAEVVTVTPSATPIPLPQGDSEIVASQGPTETTDSKTPIVAGSILLAFLLISVLGISFFRLKKSSNTRSVDIERNQSSTPQEEVNLEPSYSLAPMMQMVSGLFGGQKEEAPIEDEYDEMDDLDLEAPPAPTSHVVAVRFVPTEADEMPLEVGDLIGVEKEYSDGWARGQNISQGRKRCIFPLTVLTPITSGPSQAVGANGAKFRTKKDSFVNIDDVEIPDRGVSRKRQSNRVTAYLSNEFGLSATPEIEEQREGNLVKIIRTDYIRSNGNLVKTETVILKVDDKVETVFKTSYDHNGDEIDHKVFKGIVASTFVKILAQYK